MKKILALILSVTLIVTAMSTTLVMNTSAVVAGNLLANGSFDDGSTTRCASPYGASPVWNTTTAFHQWFRPTYGNDTINDSVIVDPNNSSNKIMSAYQTVAQGVTVESGKTYRLTFSVKGAYAFQKFNVSFADVTSAGTNTAYPMLNPMLSATGTKSYLNGSTTVTENCSPLYQVNYPAGNRVQMALATDKWVTYTLFVKIDQPYNSTQRNTTRFCALKFQADDYSGTSGNAANAPFYLDSISLNETFPITTISEDVSGQVRGYIATDDLINAAANDSVTIKAVPFSGNTFTGWYVNNTLVSSSAQYTFTATDIATYVAKFSGSTLKYIPDADPVTPDDIIATNNNLMISYPHFGTPVFTQPSSSFNAEVRAASSYGTTGWTAWVENEFTRWDCTVGTVTYGATNVYMGLKAGYSIPVTLPSGVTPELLTLVIKHGTDFTLRSPMSVSVVPNLNANYYMMDVTDTHMGWNFEDTQTGNQSPTAWGLMCQALQTTGVRYLSHTGDISLYPLASKADNIKNMMIGKQLQYSGSTLPFIMTPGNHEYDTYVYPQASITTLTTYDADGDGIPEFDGLGRFDKDTCDSYFGMQSAIMPMGSMMIAKHDFYAYWGIPALITAMGNKWNTVAPNYSYRLLFEHTHNDANQSLFSSPNYANPTPYPTLEMKGHDHAWTINQTSPYRVLSVGGGAWEGGSGAIVNFTYSGGTSWSSSADTGTWTKATTQSKLITDARYNSPAVKINPVYTNANDGTATSNSCTITNSVNFNFYDGRVRFVMAPGSYTVTNGTVLSQYDSADGTKTIVLAKVNIPASGSVTTSIASNVTLPPITGPNMIANDGFESGDVGFTRANFTNITSTPAANAHTGTKAEYVSAAQSQSASLRFVVTVTPNTNYTATMWKKTTAHVSGMNGGEFRILASDAVTKLASVYDNIYEDNQWHQMQLSFNSGSNSQISVSFQGGGEETYLDDFRLILNPNMLTNAGFESGDTGFNRANFTNITGTAGDTTYTGTKAEYCTAANSSSASLRFISTVTANTNYVATIWKKTTAHVAGKSGGEFRILASDNVTKITTITDTNYEDNQWHQFKLAFNSGTNTTISVSFQGLGDETYLDDFCLMLDPNMLVNGGFESGDTGFNRSATFVNITGTAGGTTNTGTKAEYCSAADSNSSSLRFIRTVEANKNYIATLRKKTTTTGGSNGGEIRILAADNVTKITTFDDTLYADGQWHEFQLSFNSGSNTTISVSFQGHGDETYLDDFELYLN